MKVKDLVKLLKDCDQEKEVVFSSYGEMIQMEISGIDPKDNHFITKKPVVSIEGD